MKQKTTRLIAILVAIATLVTFAKAQAPQAIPYQAAARNSSGVVLVNKTIGLRFTLHDATASGTTVYQETQNATTNAVGMFIVNIGQGSVVSGTFSNINWASGNKFMQVEYDSTASGSHYVDLGTQQLMSVPYALNSGNGVPAGTIVAFGGSIANIPAGWRLCDGSILNRADYPALFSAIGTNYGSSSSTTFTLPYTNGQFLRGANNGAASDPDAASRYAAAVGGNTGDVVGTYQNDAFASHNHFEFTVNAAPTAANPNDPTYNSPNYAGEYPGGDPNGYFMSTSILGGLATSYPTSKSGGSETRPKNVYVNYIIKE